MSQFTIYGTDNCPSCVQAKNLLTSKNLDFKFINITLSKEDQALVVSYWREQDRRPTVPLIYDNTTAEYVGNYEALTAYLKS